MLQIWVIDHRDGDAQLRGDIIAPYMIYGYEDPGPRYADFCALYGAWTGYLGIGSPPEHIGFFGYRKYLCPPNHNKYWAPAHAPNWYQCAKKDFDEYRDFMATWDGGDIKRLLAQYDILQAAPFPLNENIYTDFADSRSREDAASLRGALPDSWTSRRIYPYLFITRWSVFDRMMREMEPYRQRLEPLCTGADSISFAYIKRPMAYVMERVYSLWLENSGLSIKEVPLLHCWEMS